ncbi:MAG TPA: BamA/TamA family outer membrane protein [Puia sp.]|nr:BamA/TamA family outer membrane protein [Puia sp.]
MTYLLVPLLTLPALRTAAQDSRLDLADIGRTFFQGYHTRRIDTCQLKEGKLHTSILPVAGYTLQTGFAGVLSSNFAFYTSQHSETNLSTILASVTYSQYHQVILPIQADIWTKGNRYNIVADWRYLHYPSLTYGLGGNTLADSVDNIDYGYLRLHQAILRTIGKDLYGGLGFDLDYFWNIRELEPVNQKPTGFESYGLTKNAVASGLSVHLLYDSRRNPINPEKGGYLSLIYRPNFTFLGSDNNWAAFVMDARKYIPLPAGNHNVLAFWSYDWFTLGDGHPPYLLLPSTGWDPYSNTGRGYIQGRYRSLNMLYLESEYRFGITSNGLLGGVVFANAQSFTQPGSDRYAYIQPGYGLGLRVSLNKFSRANLCIDYGWGTHGSQGFFVNLGEVF